MSYYHINFRELVRMLLPVRLRKTVMQRWLLALTHPVSELYYKFIQNQQNNIYTLSHNSQVVYLQAVLNDIFDFADRRIYIADDFSADPLYVYLPAESHPLWLGVSGEPSSAAYQVPAWVIHAGRNRLCRLQFCHHGTCFSYYRHGKAQGIGR